MAESDSILQLGIEAAREGNKEEARNLFRLLTRQEPGNIQGWLWLAGVAENREERQSALEHVVELDPNNEMAIKGLQALGVSSTRKLDEEPDDMPAPFVPPDEADTFEEPDAFAERSRYDIDDDDPFAALDSLSEAMSESPEAVRRGSGGSEQDEMNSISAGYVPPPPPRRSARQRDRQPATRNTAFEDETVPARGGINPFLVGLVVLALLILLAVWFWPEDQQVADDSTVAMQATQTAIASGVGGVEPQPTPVPGEGDPGVVVPPVEGGDPGQQVPPAEGGDPGQQVPPAEGGDPGQQVPPVEGGEPGQVVPPTEEPVPTTAPQPTNTVPAGDPSAANPASVPSGTVLESNGWQYVFSQPNYATAIVGNLGNLQPQNGRFVLTLMVVNNTTGQSQTIPADFFVLKDAQGRVYPSQPQASTAYINQYGRGVVADLSQEDAIPSDGLRRSVPLLFDVAPDATDLMLFAPSNPDQGWLVLRDL